MKSKNINLWLLLLISCGCLTCKKELNVLPTTAEVDGNVIVDARSAAVALNGVYYYFADAGTDYNNVPTISWYDVNESIPSEATGLLYDAGNNDQFNLYTLTSQSPRIGNIWNYCYKIVNAANGFLKNVAPVNNIPAATKTQMQAEARFLRAFADEELLLYYGQYNNTSSKYGIILRDTSVTADNLNLPRTTVAATYNSILSDLDYAVAGLPALNTQKYYTNVSAAKLLKARVLLNRGATGDYAQVISLTDDLVTNGTFSLEANVQDIFWNKGFSSNEVILGLQPYATETNGKFSYYLSYGEYAVSDSLVSLFKNDPRSQWIYNTYNGDYSANYELTKYYSGDPVNLVQTPLSETSYAFRLTEAYLSQAEAITLSGGDLSKAKVLLETVEGHAGITDFSAITAAATASSLQLLIVKETMKNFVAENGLDWFALRRLPLAEIQQIRPMIKTGDELIFPIPSTEITTNSLCVQNPGYF
jgi:hypothetical protein